MTSCNQGCQKMEHQEHGEEEFVDISKVVDKDNKDLLKMRPEMREDVQGAIKSDLHEPVPNCGNVLKKSEECEEK
ncbi:unnamed protein product [Caenorhabditis brenneri]